MFRGKINTLNPVNRQHPIAKGLTSWWMGLPNNAGGLTVYDLMGTNNASFAPTYATAQQKWVGIPYGIGIGLNRSAFSVTSGLTIKSIVSTITFTFETFIRPTTTNNAAYYNMISIMSSQGIWLYGQSGNNSYKIDMYFGGDHFSTTAIALNVWTHVLISVNAGTATIYINGVADGTINSVTTTTYDGLLCDNGGGESYIGAWAYTRLWVGRSFSASEAFGVYQNALQGFPGLIRRMKPLYAPLSTETITMDKWNPDFEKPRLRKSQSHLYQWFDIDQSILTQKEIAKIFSFQGAVMEYPYQVQYQSLFQPTQVIPRTPWIPRTRPGLGTWIQRTRPSLGTWIPRTRPASGTWIPRVRPPL